MNKIKNILKISAMLVVSVIPMSSCTMIQDDIDECPQGLYVRFVYDYNTQRADMFKDHVGHVTLFVYDEQGKLAATRQVSNTPTDAPLMHYGYAMHFEPNELRPGKYRLQAVAMQRDWDETLKTDGAKYRRNNPSGHEDLVVSLDHGDVAGETGHFDVSDAAPLDTLWHTLKVMSYLPQDGINVPDPQRTTKPYSIYPIADQMVEVRDNRATYATVSLIRDTKHLSITLRQLDYEKETYADHFEVHIYDKNKTVAHDNEVIDSHKLHYTPYASWTTRFLNNGFHEIETIHKGNVGQYSTSSRADAVDESEVRQRTAHYNVMFNRMKHDAVDNANNAILDIVSKESGKTVAHINLPGLLSQARSAYEIYNYSHQEYLDREYDYHLDFFLKGEKWVYCDIVINTLSWSIRTQNLEF